MLQLLNCLLYYLASLIGEICLVGFGQHPNSNTLDAIWFVLAGDILPPLHLIALRKVKDNSVPVLDCPEDILYLHLCEELPCTNESTWICL